MRENNSNTPPSGRNIVPQNYKVDRLARQQQNGHRSLLIWCTGLSGSGKSTIANELEKQLFEKGIHTFVLDGDNVRYGLNNDLGFSEEDRKENIRRITEVSRLFIDAGIVVIAAFISPYEEDRQNIKKSVEPENYVEVFIHATLEECESRDVKGLYKKARSGEITSFTGISAPYEVPVNPDLRIDTMKSTPEKAVEQIIEYLEPKLRL